MPIIQLPDGSKRQYENAVTAATIASDIGPGLAKAAMAAKVDGHDWDLNRPIETDCLLQLITAKDSEAALELVRHDCAHLMAEAVLEDRKRLLPCSAYLDGEYGMEDVYIGVPVVLGKNGVERIVELDLEKSELDSLQASGSFYKTQLTDVLDYGA